MANTLRRAVLAGKLSADVAAMAHANLIDLRVELFPYQPFAGRVWELRENVTSYDAWYVALAEHIDASLATVDLRLSRAAARVVISAHRPADYGWARRQVVRPSRTCASQAAASAKSASVVPGRCGWVAPPARG